MGSPSKLIITREVRLSKLGLRNSLEESWLESASSALRRRLFYFAVIAVPLSTPEGWEILKYRNLKANQIEFGQNGIDITVNESASPLIRLFKPPLALKRLMIEGKTSGKLNLKAAAVQGESGSDDFVMRVGLVRPGAKRLSWTQRLVAPNWILRLYDLAPPGTGIEKIEFLNVVQQNSLLGKSRVHPKSDLLTEAFATAVQEGGQWRIDKTWPEAREILAIWIAVDGDDTKSKFQTRVRSIELISEP